MTSHKIILIVGIHSEEQTMSCSDERANEIFEHHKSDPNFVAGALYKGGYPAPFSGQPFELVASASRTPKQVAKTKAGGARRKGVA